MQTQKFLWVLAVLIIVCSLAFSMFYKLINSERFQLAGEIISRVPTTEKVVALTFDDGPNEHTAEILDTLRESNTVATFYVIGENIAQFPEETQQIVEAGHELGNHSYTHQRMVLKSNQFIQDEIEKTNALIRQAGYQAEITFRPPYGKKFWGLPKYLQQHKIKTITWDVEPLKMLKADASADEIMQLVTSKTQPGSIILIHPWYGESNASRDAIQPIIEDLRNQGYRFVTVAELLKLQK